MRLAHPAAEHLAHCHECGIWIRPHESCLHIGRMHAPRARDVRASGVEVGSLHSCLNTPGRQHDHA